MSPLTHFLAASGVILPYKLPNFKADLRCYFTNNPSSAAMRGHGMYHTRFASDVQLEMIAEELGIDPVEIRLRNAIKNPKPGKIYETLNKVHIATCGIEEGLEKVSESIIGKREKRRKK